MLARIRTPYFLLLDDHCEMAGGTRVDPLLQLVAADKLDIAAGSLLGCRRVFRFFVRRRPQSGHGLLELDGDRLTLHPGHRSTGDGFLWCDLVQNFFVARTERVRAMGGWDSGLKNDEREEFFVRAHRQGLRVGYVADVTARYWDEKQAPAPADQSPDLKSLAVARMGLARMTGLDGRTVKAPRRSRAA